MSTRAPRQSEGLVDLSVPRRIHVVGAGGPGMSALALLLHGLGHTVSGSDVREGDAVAQLRSRGIPVRVGHDPGLVAGADAVTYSTAVPADNVELEAARSAGIPVRHRADLLASLCARMPTIGVAGTHGKTTTTALLDHGLAGLGLDQSVLVGAEVVGTGVGAVHRGESLLLLEADESDGTLDILPMWGIVVTNLDVDHLDYYGSFQAMQESFVVLLDRIPGPVVLNADDSGSEPLRRAAPSGRTATFGASDGADVRIVEWSSTPTGLIVTLEAAGGIHRAPVPLRGGHNASNVAAAAAAAVALGVSVGAFLAALKDFGGVARRFTERVRVHGSLLVDDYAHLPAEIAASVAAMRTHPEVTGPVVAVFQPNRFHRVQAMAGDYAGCFTGADSVVITEIYASGTPAIEGVSGRLVHDAVAASHPELDIVWAPTRDDVVAAVLARLGPGVGCISMGCGDIETLPDDVVRSLR
jgi:UDP-N-acetylmuramate--alanine ligase